MKAIFNKGFAIFMAAWMIVSTGGFSVYAHECHCCETFDISVSEISDCCSHEEGNEICDVETLVNTPCCSTTNTAPDKKPPHNCQTSDCCKISQNFYKLDSSFDTARPFIVKSFAKLTGIIQVIDTEGTVINSYSEITDTAEQGLKYLTGRTFILFSHQLKISFSV